MPGRWMCRRIEGVNIWEEVCARFDCSRRTRRRRGWVFAWWDLRVAVAERYMLEIQALFKFLLQNTIHGLLFQNYSISIDLVGY